MSDIRVKTLYFSYLIPLFIFISSSNCTSIINESLDGDQFCQNLKNSTKWRCQKSESCWYYTQYKNENRLDDYTLIEPCGRQENSICCPTNIIGSRFCEEVKNLSGWKCVWKSDCKKGATNNQNISSIYERDIKCSKILNKKCCPPTPKPEPPLNEKIYYNSIENASKIIEQECAKLGRNASHSNRCEKDGNAFIIDGIKADEKEFPHQAAIGIEFNKVIEWLCGGSLISERFVLSAAHCAYNNSRQKAKLVLLGATKLKPMDQNTNAVNYSIVEWIFHPDHHESVRNRDIVLFKLNDTVKFNAYVKPICLATLSSSLSERAIITGFGKNESGSKASTQLLKGNVSIESNNKDCIEAYSEELAYNHPINETTIICTRNKLKMQDACKGDSGGPLQIIKSNETCYSYELHGIMSTSSYFYSDEGKPFSIYMKVSAYLDWIQYNVWPNRTIS